MTDVLYGYSLDITNSLSTRYIPAYFAPDRDTATAIAEGFLAAETDYLSAKITEWTVFDVSQPPSRRHKTIQLKERWTHVIEKAD